MVFFEFSDRIKRFFAFSHTELRDLAIATVIIGFVFSFGDWGGESVDIFVGIRHFIITLFLAAISLFFHEAAHRVMALLIGYKAEFKLWWGGLVASLIIVFISDGKIPLALPGGVVNAILVRQRLGEFRYGLNYWENGLIALYGPLANLALAFFAKVGLAIFPESYFLNQLLFLNIIMAICTMLPIPPLDGISTFFGSRVVYILAFIGILASGVLIYFTSILPAILGGILLMIIGTILYYLAFEQAPH
ncbi:MAG TPA: hypothetical protein VJH88_00060 [Candidatus Nanoarchaeia archaeon]|nr:hypothetical protein [Candidatus Nanoarchaeia archaeon]